MSSPQIPITDREVNPVALVVARGDWRAELERDYRPIAARLETAYQATLPRMQAAAQVLAQEYAEAVAAGRTGAGVLRQLDGYGALIRRVDVELRDFAGLARLTADELSALAVERGQLQAYTLAAAQVPDARLIAGAWLRPDPAALANVIRYADSEAFREKWERFAENAARNLADTLVSGAAQGIGPQRLAGLINGWFGVPYAWAENSARTIQLYSYRASSHAAYAANERIVEGWMWWAALDGRTCMSCVAKHGTIHPHTEFCNDHHRGRCRPVPIVRGSTWAAGVETGEGWFNRQPEGVQRSMMGPGAYALWRRGGFALRDYSVPYQDEVYGEMIREATLRELRGRRGRR